MGGLRAYGLVVAELFAAVGSRGPERERFAELVRQELAPAPPAARDRLGPIYARVPGARVVGPDEPTPADLDVLLDGGPVGADRAVATWRLVEALVAGLARSSAEVPGEVPDDLLTPLELPVPPVDGFVARWCRPATAERIAGLRTWSRTLGPGLDVVVLGKPGT